MNSYLNKPVRTMWDAARDLLQRGVDLRCSESWNSGYRLWIQACVSRAQGEPFELLPLYRKWLP